MLCSLWQQIQTSIKNTSRWQYQNLILLLLLLLLLLFSFWRWHTMVHVPLMFLSEWREFPSAPCLVWKKKTWWQLASRCCWNRALRLTCFPFSLCNKKRTCNSAHEQTPLSSDTIGSVPRHREVGRAKDLPVPPCIFHFTPFSNYPSSLLGTNILSVTALQYPAYWV